MSGTQWYPLPGHIVNAQVQYSDCERTKSRFPVVVSSEDFNRGHPEVIVAFATSSLNIRHPRDYDVEINGRHPHFQETGLTHSTTVRCGRLWTIDKRQIVDVIGVVPDDLFDDMHKLVVGSFGDVSKP